MVQITEWNGNQFLTFEHKVNEEIQWVFLGRQVVEALEYNSEYTRVIKGQKDKEGKWKIKPCIEEGYWANISKKDLDKLMGESHISFEVKQRGEIVITELGIYDLITNSPKDEIRKPFKDFMYNTLKQLRQNAGLKQYEAFRMMDKDIQKSVNQILAEIGDLNNAMTNNIVGNKKVNLILSQELWGFEKEINKNEMEKYCKEMLIDRQEVLKKYADYLISCDGSHTKAEECTRKWVRFKYGHIIHKLAN